jgi:hypothetical protein
MKELASEVLWRRRLAGVLMLCEDWKNHRRDAGAKRPAFFNELIA